VTSDRRTARDYGQPGPKRCSSCGTDFYRELNQCPECEAQMYSVSRHPRDGWTEQLARDTVRGLAGYAVLRLELPADNKAWMWWDDGVEARSRHPRGALESFELGLGEVLNDARSVEIVHWRETHPQIRRQLRESLPEPVDAREVPREDQ